MQSPHAKLFLRMERLNSTITYISYPTLQVETFSIECDLNLNRFASSKVCILKRQVLED